MFNMKIERQMNMQDRTLLAGTPDFDEIPKFVVIENKKFKVLGRSLGVRPPFVSLEIERTNKDLTGKEITV